MERIRKGGFMCVFRKERRRFCEQANMHTGTRDDVDAFEATRFSLPFLMRSVRCRGPIYVASY
jgi:hypothetical protein